MTMQNVDLEALSQKHRETLQKFVDIVHRDIESLPLVERVQKANNMTEQILMEEAVEIANAIKMILSLNDPVAIIEASLTLYKRGIYRILANENKLDTAAISNLKSTKEKLKRLQDIASGYGNDLQYIQGYVNSLSASTSSSEGSSGSGSSGSGSATDADNSTGAK